MNRMREILLMLLDLAIGIAYLGCIPYGIWVWITAFRGKWKRVAQQIAYPALLLAIIWPVSHCLHAQKYAEYLQGVFDTNVSLGTPIYEYESGRALNGDGYSISVYELPTAIRQRFQAADQRLLTQFPQTTRSRANWGVNHWAEGPFDPQYNTYLDFALSEYDVGREPSLAHRYQEMRAALARGRTYYAFFDYLKNIDFFVVDLEEGRLYMINHNT
jgi:hypothetical protein